MEEKTFDVVYGLKGIDTQYERDLITNKPEIRYTKESLGEILRPEVQQSIERARTFTISQNLYEYDELIKEVTQMMNDIEERTVGQALIDLQDLKEKLSERKYKEIIGVERRLSGYSQTGDFELYTVLFNMKASMEIRREFLDDRFRTQLTDETEVEKIEEAEFDSIDRWEQLEAKTMESYRIMAGSYAEDHHHATDNSVLAVNADDITVDYMATLEKQKRQMELFHTSLADTSYIHRNRYFMFLEVIEKLKTILYNPETLIDDNLSVLISGLSSMESLSVPKSHLILEFRKLREQHESIKGRMMTIDDEKESFASEKQYMYQQLEVKTTEPLKSWLYDQEENVSRAVDIFSGYMVKSMKQSRASYDETIADMLNFYRSEADYYEKQVQFLKNKEEIRRFYSIIEDLEGVEEIREDWVSEYLRANGYTV